jgi:amidohydrolase
VALAEDIIVRLNALQDEMVQIRRDLHMHPELSFHEHRTAGLVADRQRALGLDVRTGVGGMGVVAALTGGRPGPTVAVRADFDALPVVEENDVPYRSLTEGVMHACGHDAHTAIALGVAHALAEVRAELPGRVVFVHQHAEEQDPGGARAMVEDGAVDGVDAIFATHMEAHLPVGTIGHTDGYVLAASDDFFIDVRGVPGHAAGPQDTVDVVAAGAQLVSSLQQVVSRKIDPMSPAVVTVGSFHAGEAPNVIPEAAHLSGTVRAFDEQVRADVHTWLERIAVQTAAAFGATCEVRYRPSTLAVKNDPALDAVVSAAAAQVPAVEHAVRIEPNLGAEDFSCFQQRVPGEYFLTGCSNAARGIVSPYHSPTFDIDERALQVGAQTMAVSVLRFLQDGAAA